MKLIDSTFRFDGATVRFQGDMVFVSVGARRRVLRNESAEWGGRPWKPRVADCLRLIDMLRKGKRRPRPPRVAESAATGCADVSPNPDSATQVLRLFSEEQ